MGGQTNKRFCKRKSMYVAQTLDDEEDGTLACDGFDAKLWVLALASRRGLCGGCTCVCADG